MTPDPIGLEGGVNLYAYVGGDPVNKFDFMGLTESDGSELGIGLDGTIDPQLRKTMECKDKCFLKAFIGFEKAGVSATGAATGPFAIKDRRGAAGGGPAGGKTSILSKTLLKNRKRLPLKVAKSMRYLGRFASRWAGWVGAGLLIYDAKVYNECMKECLECP